MPSLNEKSDTGILPTTFEAAPLARPKPFWRTRKFLGLLGLYVCVNLGLEAKENSYLFISGEPACPQADVLTPTKNADIWTALNDKIGTPAFKTSAIDWLAGAVRVP